MYMLFSMMELSLILKRTENQSNIYLQFTRKVVHQATQVRDLLEWHHKD
jgi:hypothetical protein